jgi:iron complex outermembrane receptor protein
VKYSDLQLTTSGANLTPPNPAGVVLVNAADAKAKGFEWENTFLPMQGLTLTANVGYTDFKYTRIDPIIGTLTNRNDPRYYLVAGRPKWSGSASAQYETAEVFAGGHLSLRVDANFRGKMRIASTNTVPIQSVTRVGDQWIINARAALADFDLANGKATLAVWGRNLTNNKDLANSTPVQFGALGAIVGAMYERARTYGVDLTFDF